MVILVTYHQLVINYRENIAFLSKFFDVIAVLQLSRQVFFFINFLYNFASVAAMMSMINGGDNDASETINDAVEIIEISSESTSYLTKESSKLLENNSDNV